MSYLINNISKPYRNLKIALVADELTNSSLNLECNIYYITPLNYKLVLTLRKPDFLLVESCWFGYNNSWKYKIATYPGHSDRNNRALQKLVLYASKLGIPTVFWNKEDAIHFERFIDSASLFDFIFTVDENSITLYKSRLGDKKIVNTLMFAVQPRIHFPSKRCYKYKRACFLGSYSHHIHPKRQQLQNMLFSEAGNLGVTIFDRNSNRSSVNYRFPNFSGIEILPAVSYVYTGNIYRDYMVGLNVNTIMNSPTMFSRRLIEIIACGNIAVTTPALSVDKYFRQYCYVVSKQDEMKDLISKLKRGMTKEDKEMATEGARYISNEHIWSKRLDKILSVIS